MKLTDQEFIELWKNNNGYAAEVAKAGNMNVRSVLKRRRSLEIKYGQALEARTPKPGVSTKPSAARKDLGILNGTVIVFSDAHFWPGIHTTAFKGLLWAIKEFRPNAVIANGDIFDGASISRYPRIGWDSTPSEIQELKACEIAMG